MINTTSACHIFTKRFLLKVVKFVPYYDKVYTYSNRFKLCITIFVNKVLLDISVFSSYSYLNPLKSFEKYVKI